MLMRVKHTLYSQSEVEFVPEDSRESFKVVKGQEETEVLRVACISGARHINKRLVFEPVANNSRK